MFYIKKILQPQSLSGSPETDWKAEAEYLSEFNDLILGLVMVLFICVVMMILKQ